jgi:TonB family protein
MDHSCTSFTLDDGEKETEFVKDGDHGSWVREPDGCKIAFSPEETLLLKLGMIVTVRYVGRQDKNLVRGFVLGNDKTTEASRERPSGPCDQSNLSGRPEDRVYAVGCAGVKPPECVYCPQPPYDVKARQTGIEGKVLLELVILPDGTVSDVKIIQGLDKGLDENALQTVRKFRFKPMIGPDGNPVKVKLKVELNFRLLGSPQPSLERP